MSDCAPSSVLLIEDNPDDVLLIRDAFQRAGIDCYLHVATDADEGISYLEGKGDYLDREKHPLPAVVLIDLKLPGKSGHEVLSWMNRQKSLAQVIRVVLTGSDNPADAEKSTRLGAHGYLIKPLTTEQLTGPGRNLRMILMGNRRAATSSAGA
jgi:CheY-like chemotaxis protein